MTYRQLTPEERYMLAALRRQGLNQAEIDRSLGRHRSTVCREVRRNSTRADGRYRAFTAPERANGEGERPPLALASQQPLHRPRLRADR
jgi:IS30 family transposase